MRSDRESEQGDQELLDPAELAAGVEGLAPTELAERLVALERLVRRAEAAIVAVIDVADRQRAGADDGHRNTQGWVRATVNWSDQQVVNRMRTVTLLRDLPELADLLTTGHIGVAQVHELARARANPRCGDQLKASASRLIRHAVELPWRPFRTRVELWESLADVDGAHRSHEAAHEGRRVSTAQLDNTFHLAAEGGTVAGLQITAILDRFEQAEFAADWDQTAARWGDQACAALMPRTASQRRFDALLAIFRRAAAAPPGSVEPEPVVNLVVSREVYEAELAHLTGNANATRPDPAALADWRCGTIDGIHVDPADIVAASLLGRVRRVVFDAGGLTINLGPKARVFTGAAREAALLAGDGRCLWPGCGHHRTQIDHLVPHHQRGPTRQDNAGLLCARHNRWKNHGYTTWRDATGHWHLNRPDGTEVRAA